jgi:hypothetical protein
MRLLPPEDGGPVEFDPDVCCELAIRDSNSIHELGIHSVEPQEKMKRDTFLIAYDPPREARTPTTNALDQVCSLLGIRRPAVGAYPRARGCDSPKRSNLDQDRCDNKSQ